VVTERTRLELSAEAPPKEFGRSSGFERSAMDENVEAGVSVDSGEVFIVPSRWGRRAVLTPKSACDLSAVLSAEISRSV